MTLLLDTHALLWWVRHERPLSKEARAAVADPDNTVYVSAVCVWEIAIKVALGKLGVPSNVARWLPDEIERNRFLELPVSIAHAAAVEQLPPHHYDPFDRLLVAQAQVEKLTLVTSDLRIERYDVRTLRA